MSSTAGSNGQGQVIKIIAGAMLMSILVLVGVGCFIASKGTIESNTLDPNLLNILTGIAAILILFASSASKMVATGDGAKMTGVIVGYALREAGTIIGLALTFLSGDMNWVLGLGGLAFAMGVVNFPKN